MTVTVNSDQNVGSRAPVQAMGLETVLLRTGTIDCDNSYPSGGYDVTDITGFFRRCDNIILGVKSGYLAEYNSTTEKVLIKTPVPAQAAHTHTDADAGNVEVEEEAIAAPSHQRIYHGAITGSFGIGNVVRGGTSNATMKIADKGADYIECVVGEIGLDAVYDLNVELVNDYNAHCANDIAHIAADTANDGVALPTARTWSAVYVSLNALKAAYNTHDAESGTYHGAAGAAHQTASADATTPASASTLANELKTDYEAHRAEGDTLYALTLELQTDLLAHMGNAVHMAADTTNNDFTQLGGQKLSDITTTLNSMKAKYNSHDGESGTFHPAAGTASQVAAADAATYAEAITLANAIKAAYEAHRVLSTGVWTLISELRTDYIAHCAMGAGTHTTADVTNNGVAAVTSTFASFMAFVNDLKAKYNAHDVETGTYHPAAGTAHQVSAADATDWATLKALANDIKAVYNAHCADAVAHAGADATNTTAAADAADETHLFPDLVNTIAGADAAAGLHVTPDATNNITTANSGVTLQTAEVLTDQTTSGTATSSTIAIDVWDLAFPPAEVQTVINQANARLGIETPSMTLVTTECRVDLANSEIETLLSDAYTSLKVTYLKDAEATGTTGTGGAIAADLAEEVTAGTNLSTLTGIPYLAWGI